LTFFKSYFSVAKARAEGPTLFLNAGDTYQGTSWYTVYKGDLAAELMNMLNPDAMVGIARMTISYIIIMISSPLASPLETTNLMTISMGYFLFLIRSIFL